MTPEERELLMTIAGKLPGVLQFVSTQLDINSEVLRGNKKTRKLLRQLIQGQNQLAERIKALEWRDDGDWWKNSQ